MTICPDSYVIASPDSVSCDLAGEAVLLNFKDGVYYGLKGAGANVWKLLGERRTVRGICDELVEEFEVERDRCERDLVLLLEKLVANGLAVIEAATEH